ncbi:TIGR02611 family protein [Kineosporia sp. J2-2]|uniref:TIGR02611 family protein n=1 Tax=Kineosporia corallincola TaxID=2835133 RepID=A0ABS5TE13_9ACTN|nr:TIGR02611 family protein [Kineosporia corallincola]MBT0769088.1 TIGR02611 family protein [Kineosporia corallincola]
MKQTGDGPVKPAQKSDEVRHDQQEDDDVELDPRVWVRRFKAWREALRQRPSTNRLYRLVVGLVGGGIVVGGLALVPLPGPGWLIVFLGLAVLATEFTWADRLEKFARKQVGAWTKWLMAQPIYVRALVGLATAALVVAIFWVLFRVTGVPGWIPDNWIPAWSGLG